MFAPVVPARPAARDGAGAQVDALDTGQINEDLAPRERRGQPRHELRIELEGERLLARRGERVGAQHRGDDAAQRAPDAIVVDSRYRLEPTIDSLAWGADRGDAIALLGGVVCGSEARDQGPPQGRKSDGRGKRGSVRVGLGSSRSTKNQ